MTSTKYLPGFEQEERRPELSQWYTEPRLAERVWRWANRFDQPRIVLEPAAGHGALVRPILAQPFGCTDVLMVDIDPRCAEACGELALRAQRAGKRWEAVCLDFLEWRPGKLAHGLFDLALMNPPYEEGRAEEFVLRALSYAERVVGIFKASIQHGIGRYRMLWSRARVTREVKLATRPTFGRGEAADSGKTDYVVLEIKRLGPGEDMATERWVVQEHWA